MGERGIRYDLLDYSLDSGCQMGVQAGNFPAHPLLWWETQRSIQIFTSSISPKEKVEPRNIVDVSTEQSMTPYFFAAAITYPMVSHSLVTSEENQPGRAR